MTSVTRVLAAIGMIAAALSFSAGAAQAQATRTWVSGVGDDANPCSRTAPCKTFAGAISKTADGGEIDCIDPGGFGAVTITKSITIDGGGTFGSILASGSNGVNVNDSNSGAPNTKVVQLRNLSINGATTGLIGVNITSAATVFIENCVIFGFRAGSGRAISDTRTGLNDRLFVVDTTVKNNSGNGIVIGTDVGFVSTVTGFFDNVRSIGNTAAGAVFCGGSKSTVRHSEFSGNGQSGVQVSQQAGGTTVANLVSSVFSHNKLGVFAGPNASVTRIADVTITHNTSAGTDFGGW